MYSEIPNRSRVQIISPTFGVIRNEPLEEAMGRCETAAIYLST
jgi:hypothetical protein